MQIIYVTKKDQEHAERFHCLPLSRTVTVKGEIALKLWLRINEKDLAQYTVEH